MLLSETVAECRARNSTGNLITQPPFGIRNKAGWALKLPMRLRDKGVLRFNEVRISLRFSFCRHPYFHFCLDDLLCQVFLLYCSDRPTHNFVLERQADKSFRCANYDEASKYYNLGVKHVRHVRAEWQFLFICFFYPQTVLTHDS